MRCIYTLTIFCSALAFVSCNEKSVVIEHGNLVLTYNEVMYGTVSSLGKKAKPFTGEAMPSEYLETKKSLVTDFTLIDVKSSVLKDEMGSGKKYVLKGLNKQGDYSIQKIVEVKLYDTLPDLALITVFYINTSPKDIGVTRWVNHHYRIISQGDSTLFWSFQGQSTGNREDWIKPLSPGFYQKNYMGMNNTDYGGGIPVIDIWRPDQGIAIGHAELVPRLVSLPVEIDPYETTASVHIEMEYENPHTLKQGDTLKTDETFVTVHSGDYYTPLKKYGELLRAKGLQFIKPEAAAFEPSWCAWGYMREFTVDEVLGTLPKVKELGIKWATVDDGFQQAEGDWHVNKKTFPGGDAQMRAMVDKIHSYGLKAMIWWAPLAADPESKLLQENPDLKLLNEDESPQYITWWDSYYMAPTYSKTIDHTKEMIDLFLNKWNFDGLKMDGQHMNAVPPDYNSIHELTYPEEAVEKLPLFFKTIYETAEKIKPHAVIQNCPCGTCMSVFNMPYMNQAVASDPTSSYQIRHKGKTYKALIEKIAYFGDHVELSDHADDFASSFGVGAVLGTKFTWPKDNPKTNEKNVLTPEREIIWKKWFQLYNKKMLSKEKYLGSLYDIGYDIPETHVIQKADTLHYAFYNADWSGEIELRGLSDKTYRVRDYVNDIDLGKVSAMNPRINTTFKQSLLIEVYPE